MEQFNPKPVAEDIETKVGDLSGLNTTEKTSLVGAVNEVNEHIAPLIDWVLLGQGNSVGEVSINGKFSDYKMIAIVLVQPGLNNKMRLGCPPMIIPVSMFKLSDSSYTEIITDGYDCYYVSDTKFYISGHSAGIVDQRIYGILS